MIYMCSTNSQKYIQQFCAFTWVWPWDWPWLKFCWALDMMMMVNGNEKVIEL